MAVKPHSCLPRATECARKITLRSIHTRDFAPEACSRGTLRKQSSSVFIDLNVILRAHPVMFLIVFK